MAEFNQFQELDIRVGTIIKVEDFPEARKAAYKLVIDFGEFGCRKSSAKITQLYNKTTLLGKQILAVVNFPPRQIGPFISEVLCLGVPDKDGNVVLVKPEKNVENGVKLY